MLVKTKEVAPSVYALTIPTPFLVGPVNVYVIEGEALTLVDTGPNTEEARSVITEELGRLGYRPQDIEVLILTHHHPDHIGLTEMFSHAALYGHEKLLPWLENNHSFHEHKARFFSDLYRSHGVPDSVRKMIEGANSYYAGYASRGNMAGVLKENDGIPGLPGWSVIETPGHAQSQISLFRESDGVLISGDHLIKHISSNAIIEAPYVEGEDRPKTLLQYRDSLKKCRHVRRAFSGHGEPVDNPAELIEERLGKQLEKAAAIKNLAGSETLTAFEICVRLYPQMYKKQPGLTLSETLGHLDLLEVNGEMTVRQENGVFYYRAVD
ncbi:MBL fold metallo-hydrolase [Alteribacter natronophilus]|uniref:MBL fold metallo-hydrolase n=1 Tax=Alteribacter natronophilus TaxID=2583810 RepID=UPI00110F1A72|nr:MBL fold metallo-hydrolase [Alteribacter natronophilus]TMW70620.1 MBL fold metallo-hydrolase [Alteribacter natronophilus]